MKKLLNTRGNSLAVKYLIMGCFAACIFLIGCELPTKTPNRYFQLDLVLEINHKPYPIVYNWHCYESKNLSEGDGSFHPQWNSSPFSFHVLKRIGENSALLFKPPQYCGAGTYTGQMSADGQEYYPEIIYIKSIGSNFPIEIYSKHRIKGDGTILEIKSATVTQSDKQTPDYVMSDADLHLIEVLKTSIRGYQAVSAVIIPADIWKKSESLNQYFKEADGILIAPAPTQINSSIVGQDGKNNFFPVNQREIPHLKDLEMYIVSMIKNGNVWSLPLTSDSSSAITYFSYEGVKSNPVTVSYYGMPITVISSQQIFDSRKQLLIQLLNQGFPYISVKN